MAARKNSQAERVAALEATMAAQNATHTLVLARLDSLNEAIEEVRVTQAKHKSFLGGVIFAVSAVWAIVLAGLNYFGK